MFHLLLTLWWSTTVATTAAVTAAYGLPASTIRVTRQNYLDALGTALAGDRGPWIRSALAPGSLDPAAWPADARFYVGDAGGYAIVDDKLCGLFATRRGQGDVLVTDAVRNGARRLDHFDVGPLSDLYSRHGFREVARVANWVPGQPDVVYRSRRTTR